MRAAILLMAGLAGGCAAGGSTVHSTRNLGGVASTDFISLAAAPVVEIRGAPPGGASPEMVAAALRLPSGFAQRPFRLAAPGESGTRLVLVFGARAIDESAVCTPGGGGVGGAPARLEVGGALCVGERARASGVLVSNATDPSDPAYVAALQALTNGMRQADDRPRPRLGAD